MTRDRTLVRAYRHLTRLYPRAFRDEYGADMVQLLRDQCADEPTWRVVGRAVLDLAMTIPTQHLEARMHRPSTHLVPLMNAALAAAGLLVAALGGSNIPMMVAGLVLALISGTVAFVAWKRSGPIYGGISTNSWWKLLLAGPAIIVAVIVAAELGVDAWMAGMFAIFAAVLVTGTGAILGIAHIARRRSRAVTT